MPVTLLAKSLHTVGSRELLPPSPSCSYKPDHNHWVKITPDPQTKVRQEANGGDLILDSLQLLNFFSP